MTLLLDLPITLPSLNASYGKRSGYHVVRKLKLELSIALAAAIVNEVGRLYRAGEPIPPCLQSPRVPIERARIHYVRYGKRKLDNDNLIGSAKPLLDALKRAGIILDDDAEHVSVTYAHERGEHRTLVSVSHL